MFLRSCEFNSHNVKKKTIRITIRNNKNFICAANINGNNNNNHNNDNEYEYQQQ